MGVRWSLGALLVLGACAGQGGLKDAAPAVTELPATARSEAELVSGFDTSTRLMAVVAACRVAPVADVVMVQGRLNGVFARALRLPLEAMQERAFRVVSGIQVVGDRANLCATAGRAWASYAGMLAPELTGGARAAAEPSRPFEGGALKDP